MPIDVRRARGARNARREARSLQPSATSQASQPRDAGSPALFHELGREDERWRTAAFARLAPGLELRAEG